jgi:predicted Zn-dependent peptidase
MRLKTLLDQHAITQADFDAQKRAILQGTPAQQEPAELQRLKQLLNAGVLTQEEYDSQRKGFMA